MTRLELFLIVITAFYLGIIIGIMWSNNEREEEWTKEEVEKAIKHIKRKFGI